MPRTMIDAIGADSGHIPATATAVAGYTTGSSDIVWTPAEWDRFSHTKIRIDQAPGSSADGDVLDSESGAKTIMDCVNAVQLHGPRVIYLSAANLTAARQTFARCGLKPLGYFVANWALSAKEAAALLGGDIVAIQYASPTSNPNTLLPGSRLTLREANCDLSVISDEWMPAPATAKPQPQPQPVHRKVTAAALGAAIATGILAAIHSTAGLHLTPTETGAIASVSAFLGGYLVPEKS